MSLVIRKLKSRKGCLTKIWNIIVRLFLSSEIWKEGRENKQKQQQKRPKLISHKAGREIHNAYK